MVSSDSCNPRRGVLEPTLRAERPYRGGVQVPSTNAQPQELAPPTAQAAMQQSDVVAQNIRAIARNEPLERFRSRRTYRHLLPL